MSSLWGSLVWYTLVVPIGWCLVGLWSSKHDKDLVTRLVQCQCNDFSDYSYFHSSLYLSFVQLISLFMFCYIRKWVSLQSGYQKEHSNPW